MAGTTTLQNDHAQGDADMTVRQAFMAACVVAGVTGPTASARQSWGLPRIDLLVADSVLTILDGDPLDNTRHPARLAADGDTLDVLIRYRGSSSRDYAKKSWKVVFSGPDNPFGAYELNLNAEFNDRTLLRNVVNMALFASLGFLVPSTEHVWLVLNGNPSGVYVLTEQVDRLFFERRGIDVDALFKSVHWAASLAPNLVDARFGEIFERKEGDRGAETDLKSLLSTAWFANEETFVQAAGSVLDLEALVAYEAGNLLIMNRDGFSKNYYLYREGGGSRLSFVPWDMDGSLGQDWAGDPDPSLASWASVHSIYMVPFQRLMQRPAFTALMDDILTTALTTGHPLMRRQVDSLETLLSDAVAHDPYLQDGPSYSESVQTVRSYLEERAAFLSGWLPYPVRPPRPAYSAQSPGDGKTTFTVTGVPGDVSQVDLVLGLDLDLATSTVDTRTFPLVRIGEEPASGLDLYGATLDLTGFVPQVAPFIILYDGTIRWPENGFVDVVARPQASPALRIPGGDEASLSAVVIHDASPSDDLRLLRLRNDGPGSLDVSWLRLRGPDPDQVFILPPSTRIPPGDSVWLTDDPVVAETYGGNDAIFGGLTLDVGAGDSIAVVSPMGETLFRRKLESVAVTPETGPVVINEINYNSSDTIDPGDWVELLNPGAEAVNMSAWLLSDEVDEHAFVIPAGTTLPADGYLVVAADPVQFATVHPDVQALGPIDFGFSAQGDVIRVFDAGRRLVDAVAYGDAAPWPSGADGEGYTLELLEPGCDNANASCWARSATLYGTPGARNLATGLEYGNPDSPSSFSLYPNPASDLVHLQGPAIRARVELFDTWGRRLGTAREYDLRSVATLNLSGLATGLYFVRLTSPSGVRILPVVIAR
jgi:spore coat protein H